MTKAFTGFLTLSDDGKTWIGELTDGYGWAIPLSASRDTAAVGKIRVVLTGELPIKKEPKWPPKGGDDDTGVWVANEVPVQSS